MLDFLINEDRMTEQETLNFLDKITWNIAKANSSKRAALAVGKLYDYSHKLHWSARTRIVRSCVIEIYRKKCIEIRGGCKC